MWKASITLFLLLCSAHPMAGQEQVDLNKVYPWVKLNVTGVQGPTLNADLIERDLVGDLFLIYVEDTGTEFKVLFKKHLPPGMSVEQFHALAVKNLRRDLDIKLEHPTPDVAMLVAGGDHEAGVLCLPEKWAAWAKENNDDLVVAVLSKDVVLFVKASDADARSTMELLAERTTPKLERLLSKKRFLYTARSGSWSVLPND